MSFVDGLYIYSQKYYQFLLSQIKQIIAKNPKVTSSMFSHLDILHPSGHSNFQQFLSKYPFYSSSKVFQIGCGLGGTTRFLVQKTDCFVHALDFLPHYLQLAKIITQSTNQLSNISYNQGDINTYPIQENTYDLTFQIAVFVLIQEMDGYKTIAKSLKPGGLFYFQDYFLMKKLEDLTTNDRNRLKIFDIEGVKTKEVIFEALERNGLQLVEFVDRSARWSEFAWIRGQGIQEEWKSGKKDPNPQATKKYAQYGQAVPGLMRNLDHIEDIELQKRFPLTLEAVGGLDAVREPHTLSSTSMVWRKK